MPELKRFHGLIVRTHINTFCVLYRVKANEQKEIENKKKKYNKESDSDSKLVRSILTVI